MLLQVSNCKNQLLRAVKEVWGTQTYDDQFRLAVFASCLQHGLTRVSKDARKPSAYDFCINVGLPQGGETGFKLTPVLVSYVEAELAKGNMLRGKSLITLLAKHTDFFRVMEKAHSAPAVLPWLHDILPYPQ